MGRKHITAPPPPSPNNPRPPAFQKINRSVWGLFTISGVKATTMRVTLPPHQQPPQPGNSKDRQGGAGLTGPGALPFGTSASGWRFLRGSSSAGGGNGNGNGLVAPRGSDAGAADAAASKGKGCGATWYRADSFLLQKSSMGVTQEWVSLPAACLHPGFCGLVCLPALVRFAPPRVLGAIISCLPYCTGSSREGILVLILLSYFFSNKL